MEPARRRGPCEDRGVSEHDDAQPGPDEAPHGHDPRPAEADADDTDDRESAYALLQRGQALMRKRHNAQAAVVLARAAVVEPGKGSILESLGRAQFMARDLERARETFEALLEVDPSSHYAHYALGQSLRKLDRDMEALTHLRLAVALQPRSALYRSALHRATPPTEE
jgi:Flp pilus assembly protein TadD